MSSLNFSRLSNGTLQQDENVTNEQEYKINVTNGPDSFKDWPMITMYGEDFRKEVHNMYVAARELNMLHKFKSDPGQGGFMFSTHVDKVFEHSLVLKDGHSGATQSCAARILQQVVSLGWNEFKNKFPIIKL